MAFPKELLSRIDKLAKANYTTRSDYIRRAMVEVTKDQEEDISASAWKTLLASAAELADNAQKSGYKTDADFERLAREIRQNR